MNNIECTDLDQHPRQQNIISESRTTHRTTKRTSEPREWEGWRLVVATPIGRRPGVINSRPDLPQSHTINPLSVSRRTFTHTQKQAKPLTNFLLMAKNYLRVALGCLLPPPRHSRDWRGGGGRERFLKFAVLAANASYRFHPRRWGACSTWPATAAYARHFALIAEVN